MQAPPQSWFFFIILWLWMPCFSFYYLTNKSDHLIHLKISFSNQFYNHLKHDENKHLNSSLHLYSVFCSVPIFLPRLLHYDLFFYLLHCSGIDFPMPHAGRPPWQQNSACSSSWGHAFVVFKCEEWPEWVQAQKLFLEWFVNLLSSTLTQVV